MSDATRTSRVRGAILYLAFLVVSTGVLLGLLELGIRRYAGPVAFVSDEEVIAVLRPSTAKVFVRAADGGPRFVRWRTNEDGFRGPELLDDPSLRVLVYGDSNIQARFSVWEESFTGQLQRLLRASVGEEAEVVNGGVCGYGPDQSLLRFEREVSVYEPDVVVLHVFADNDFGDLIRNRLFELGQSGELVRTSFPFVEDVLLRPDWWNGSISETIKNLKLSIWPQAILKGRARSAALPELAHDPEGFRAYFLARSQSEFDVYARGLPRAFSWMADHYEADLAFAPDSESAKTKLALMEAVLRRAQRVAAEASVRLVVLIQPASRDVAKTMNNHYEVLARYPEYDRRRMTRALVSMCRDAGIDYVDLYDVYTKSGDPESLYFPIDDDHWDEDGQRVAAEATAERILSGSEESLFIEAAGP